MNAAERWITNAEVHARENTHIKDYYRQIEDNMRSLIARERGTPNSVARSQFSVKVTQGNISGMQVDLHVNYLWDRSIGDTGREIDRQLASYPADCDRRLDLQTRGAAAQAIDAWQAVCQQVQAERAKSEPLYAHIMAQRGE